MKKHLRSVFTLTVIATALSACGGSSSGGDSSSTDASSKASASTSIAQMGGTYIMPCSGKSFTQSFDPDSTNSESKAATIVITPDGSGKASISAHYQYFEKSARCDPAALDFDMTFIGTASDKAGSKIYKNADGKLVKANLVTVAYSGFKLAKGSLNVSLPRAGATTDMAYVLDNNTLFLSKGPRDADGVGAALTKKGAVKQ